MTVSLGGVKIYASPNPDACPITSELCLKRSIARPRQKKTAEAVFKISVHSLLHAARHQTARFSLGESPFRPFLVLGPRA